MSEPDADTPAVPNGAVPGTPRRSDPSSEPTGTAATALRNGRPRTIVCVAPAGGASTYRVLDEVRSHLDAGVLVAVDLSRLSAQDTALLPAAGVDPAVMRGGPDDRVAHDQIGGTDEPAHTPTMVLRWLERIAEGLGSTDIVAGLRLDHPAIPSFLRYLRSHPPRCVRAQVSIPDDFLAIGDRNGPFHLLDPDTLETTTSIPAMRLLEQVTETAWQAGAPDMFLVDRADDERSRQGDRSSLRPRHVPVAVHVPQLDCSLGHGQRIERGGPQPTPPACIWSGPGDILEAFRALVTSPRTFLAVRPLEPRLSDVVVGGQRASAPPAPSASPLVLQGWTHEIETACGRVYVTINVDDTGPVALHVSRAKGSPCVNAHLEATGRLVSLALQAGVEPEWVVESLRNVRCSEPLVTDHGVVHGCVDAIGRALERQFLGTDGPQHPVSKQVPLDGFTPNGDASVR